PWRQTRAAARVTVGQEGLEGEKAGGKAVRVPVLVFGAVLLSGSTHVLSVPALPAKQEHRFRSSSSELVVLPVVVKARHDRYVADLAKERFVVYDNGRRMPIEFFSNEDIPVTVGLIIDASGSMRNKLGEVIAASVAFAKSSNPNDELFAIHFNDNVQE